MQKAEAGNAQVLFEKLFAAVSVPTRILTPHPAEGFKKAHELQGFVRASHAQKVEILREVGMENPMEDEVTPTLKVHETMSEQSLAIYVTTVRFNLKLLSNVRLVVVPPLLTQLIHNEVPGTLQAGEGPVLKEKRLRCLRSLFQSARMMLVPLLSGGHWVLLSIEKTSEGGVEVEYYDSLAMKHERCLRSARATLTLLGLPSEGLQRCNEARQSANECGYYCCH